MEIENSRFEGSFRLNKDGLKPLKESDTEVINSEVKPISTPEVDTVTISDEAFKAAETVKVFGGDGNGGRPVKNDV